MKIYNLVYSIFVLANLIIFVLIEYFHYNAERLSICLLSAACGIICAMYIMGTVPVNLWRDMDDVDMEEIEEIEEIAEMDYRCEWIICMNNFD